MRHFLRLSIIAIASLILSPHLWAQEFFIQSQKIKDATILGPNDSQWMKQPSVRIPLVAQNFVAQRGGGGAAWVDVRAAHTHDEIMVRLSWQDATKSVKLASSGKFTDACAVMFPLDAASVPSPFMGEKGKPVNIWMWKAVVGEEGREPLAYVDFYRTGAIDSHVTFQERPGENLVAEGFGTLTPSPVQDVEASGSWQDGRWSVVLRKRFDSKEGPKFQEGQTIAMAAAVWDGSKEERDGAKSLAFWQTLLIGKNAKAPAPETSEAKGERTFARYGCAACHGAKGLGGVKNANAQGGEVPPLNSVAEGFTKEEIKTVIRKGRVSVPDEARGPIPPLHMNNWEQVLDDQELDDLVSYLWSLKPKDSQEW
ncbi:MAG: c-type cytochrome [Elusimicrobia bacterium]|nr:c-type cytochrome [Elusimicrobiota bacterium]